MWRLAPPSPSNNPKMEFLLSKKVAWVSPAPFLFCECFLNSGCDRHDPKIIITWVEFKMQTTLRWAK